MSNEEISRYIRENLKKGFTEEQIRKKLQQANYPDEEISAAFSSHGLQRPKTMPNIKFILAALAVILLLSSSFLYFRTSIFNPRELTPEDITRLQAEFKEDYCKEDECKLNYLYANLLKTYKDSMYTTADYKGPKYSPSDVYIIELSIDDKDKQYFNDLQNMEIDDDIFYFFMFMDHTGHVTTHAADIARHVFSIINKEDLQTMIRQVTIYQLIENNNNLTNLADLQSSRNTWKQEVCAAFPGINPPGSDARLISYYLKIKKFCGILLSVEDGHLFEFAYNNATQDYNKKNLLESFPELANFIN